MQWNWQHSEWPSFRYDAEALRQMEAEFLQGSGFLIGSVQHLERSEREQLTVELLSDEALKTSEIEGEYLNRESVQSSVRKQFGLQVESGGRATAAEQGIAEMMVDVYRHFDQPLTEATLFNWHARLLAGRRDLPDIGGYRNTAEPMQIVSGALDAPKVHFVAPPSQQVRTEMARFMQWWANSGDLPALTRAGIAHLHFLAIHPFIDGNGRIARALTEKLLAQAIGQPTLLALAQTIEADRKSYYQALQATNRQLEIDGWLCYFAETLLRAQKASIQKLDFLIRKGQFLDQFEGPLNPRQIKVIKRLFQAGPGGFTGGLSAKNYLAITKTSRATATRDLQDLVQKAALTRTGDRKHTRYWLKLD